VSIYRFIDAEKASYPVSALCRVLRISRSGYYEWKDRPPSRRDRKNATLTARIREIHQRSRETSMATPQSSCRTRSPGSAL
jgi:putative transposase